MYKNQSGIIMYTAIFGDITDELRSPFKSADCRLNVSFFAFLDGRNKSSGAEKADEKGWDIFQPHFDIDHPRRRARAHKVLAHQIFPACEYSFWIDGCLQFVQGDIPNIIDRYLQKVDICVFRHRSRRCVYEELTACLDQKKDDERVMTGQIDRYLREEYPRWNGLAETTAVLRRHNEITSEFNERWWSEIKNGSYRDQLSFDYVAWKLGLKYEVFHGTSQKNDYFKWFRH